jgi:hypothetical protein
MVMVIVRCGVYVVVRMEFGVCLPSIAIEWPKLGSLNLNVCQFLFFFTQCRGDSLHNCQLFPNCLVKIHFVAELLFCFFQPAPRPILSG